MNTESQTDRITQLEAELDKAQKEREQFKNALYMHVEFPSHGEALEKASKFQQRIKELESELSAMREGVQRIYDNPAYAQPWAEGLLKTSSGKSLLDRLQAVEESCKYWVEQHGVEAAKRGEAEHQLDLVRGNLAESFEKLERELQAAEALLTESSDLLGEFAAFGNCDCDIPNGKTCEVCQAAMLQTRIKEALQPAQKETK